MDSYGSILIRTANTGRYGSIRINIGPQRVTTDHNGNPSASRPAGQPAPGSFWSGIGMARGATWAPWALGTSGQRPRGDQWTGPKGGPVDRASVEPGGHGSGTLMFFDSQWQNKKLRKSKIQNTATATAPWLAWGALGGRAGRPGIFNFF